MCALVADPGLAALAGVAGRAAARVRALPSVPAGGAVLARPVGKDRNMVRNMVIFGRKLLNFKGK